MTTKPFFRAKREREAKRAPPGHLAPSGSGKTSADVRCDPKDDGQRSRSAFDPKDKGKRTSTSGSKDSAASSGLQRRPSVVALPSSPRRVDLVPPKQKDDGVPSRKRLASDKGAPNQSTPNKKKRIVSSDTVGRSGLARESVAVPGVPSSRSPKIDFISPGTLSQPRAYGEMSGQGLKFVESINKMVAEYENSARDDLRRLDDEKKKALALKEKLSSALSKSESELENTIETLSLKHEAEMDLSVAKVERLEKENVDLRKDLSKKSDLLLAADRRKARVELELVTLKSQQESAVRGAREALERELSTEFQVKLERVKSSLSAVMVAKKKEVELAQIDANLEFIGLLRDGKVPDLDSEEAELTGLSVGLEGAYSRCGGIIDDLVGELGLAPFSPSPSGASDLDREVITEVPIVAELVDEAVHPCEPGNVARAVVRAESVERVAVSMGVSDPHGSNVGTPAAEELASSKAGSASDVSEARAVAVEASAADGSQVA